MFISYFLTLLLQEVFQFNSMQQITAGVPIVCKRWIDVNNKVLRTGGDPAVGQARKQS